MGQRMEGGDFMLDRYFTVQQLGVAETVVKRSRFIGHAMPVSDEKEAEAFIQQIKKKHSAASHNCSAYMIGERNEIQKQSDDGEPSGTAGKPILEVIKNKSLKNIVVVVTRYFGGVKLGASGLIRAYTEGSVVGIEAAIPIEQVLHQRVTIEVEYTWQGKLENELRQKNTMLEETQFTDKVTYSSLPEAAEAELFMDWVTDLTQGRGMITAGEQFYVPHTL